MNNNANDIKTFISFLNITQIRFKLLDFVTPIEYGYHIAYLDSFNKWCGYELLNALSNNNNNKYQIFIKNYPIFDQMKQWMIMRIILKSTIL